MQLQIAEEERRQAVAEQQKYEIALEARRRKALHRARKSVVHTRRAEEDAEDNEALDLEIRSYLAEVQARNEHERRRNIEGVCVCVQIAGGKHT